MVRQSAFPGIMVESIQVQTPPFDEPGVIQEFVGEGVTREFTALKRANEISKDSIEKFLKEAEDMIGPLRDTYRIRYTLLIRATTNTRVSERGAKARARVFTRVKNPFEPDFIHIRRTEVDTDLSGGTVMGKEIGTVFRVVTEVTK